MVHGNTKIVYITHITYITHIIYIIHRAKLIFKKYKKAAKIFFYKFFSIYKNVSKILPKIKETFSKKACERYQNLSAEGNTEKCQ